MDNCLTNEEKACLVEDIKNVLSGGIHKVEITDSAWCSLLKFSIEEYVMRIQNWLIDNQWTSLNGKDLTVTDICFSLTNRSFDYELQFSYAYSKQVGLQQRGPYELKKDFVTIEEGKQVYEIPAGREINSVLWLTPSDIDHAKWAALTMGNLSSVSGGGGVMGWNGGSANMFQNVAYYVAPAYDIFLRGADINLKNRVLMADMTYKITAGPNGTRLLHLLSTPNDGNKFGTRKRFVGCKVWYHYYDTEAMDAEEKNKCLTECKDIIKFPSDVPLQKMDYCDLNDPSKVWVRKYLTAFSKETLGRSRGKFQGKVAMPNAELTMDYDTLLAEGKEEKEKLVQELTDWLLELRSDKQLARRAEEANNITTILSKTPLGFFVI